MRLQAASDARTFAEAILTAQEFHAAEVARLEGEISDRTQLGNALHDALVQASRDHQQQLLAQVC